MLVLAKSDTIILKYFKLESNLEKTHFSAMNGLVDLCLSKGDHII